jgi:CMP-N-acetylneuraminic acid synthetase
VKIFTYIKDNSKRVEKKNFIKIGNLELWKHLIYELAESGCKIFIDTDSDVILEECNSDKKLTNVLAYRRKPEFIKMENSHADNLSPSLLMIENFIDKYVIDDNETIVLTHVTSPFLKKETILKAVAVYEEGNYDFAHSVVKEHNFAFLNDFDKPINFNPNVVQKTQDLEPLYMSNGAFFIFNKKVFKRDKNRWGKNIYFYFLDKIESIEIDYLEDVKLAEIVYQSMIKESKK